MNLYWNQTASVRVDGEHMKEITTRRKVRQGCIFSPFLFNLYSEEIFQKASDDLQDGILINEECLKETARTDD